MIETGRTVGAIKNCPKDMAVWLTKYASDGSTAIVLTELDDPRSVLIKATVCVQGIATPPPRHICYIKDYSENEGILDALTEAGIVSRNGKKLMLSNFAYVHQCTLAPALAEIAKSKLGEVTGT